MTTDRHDPDATSGLDDEFWGEQTEWTPQRPPSAERRGFGVTVGRWWNGLLGGDSAVEGPHGVGHRMHGRETVPTSQNRSEDSETVGSAVDLRDIAGDVALVADDDDSWTFEPQPQPNRGGGVDPLIARLGGLAVILTLAAPLVVGFASSTSDSDAAEPLLAMIAGAPSQQTAAPSVAISVPAPAAVAIDEPASTTNAAPGTASTTDAPGEIAVESPAPASVDVAALKAAPVPEPEPATTAQAVTVAPCGNRYDLAAGDYWIRIADAAGVSLADLLAVNDASVDTVLVPGRSICLPVGASTPAPPTPVAATPAPAASSNTTAPRRSTPTTVAPAPATTTPPRPAAVPESQAAAIIRDVWPDDLEERALAIAWRESNHRSNVNNWCCYGLFQIHWTAHRSWLATLGVTSASQLYDPVVNANAAYMLYRRAGGFGPWGG